jgi:hypothetical protein
MLAGLFYTVILVWLMSRAAGGIKSIDDFFGCTIAAVFLHGVCTGLLWLFLPAPDARFIAWVIVSVVLYYAGSKRERLAHGAAQG